MERGGGGKGGKGGKRAKPDAAPTSGQRSIMAAFLGKPRAAVGVAGTAAAPSQASPDDQRGADQPAQPALARAVAAAGAGAPSPRGALGGAATAGTGAPSPGVTAAAADTATPGCQPSAAPPARPGAPTAGSDAGAAASFSEGEAQQARQQLLAWYDRVHRVLPWRRNPHSQLPQQPGDAAAAAGAPAELSPQDFAYRVWVSEIMLQQTQVRADEPRSRGGQALGG
jgi:hypothetical protein